jgi:uncharacterized protein YbjT (DUF2867 family)
MILVAGATGTLGSMITHRLLSEGKRVRILVRGGTMYHELVEAGAEAVLGDLRDRDSLDLAMRGVRVVISTANSAKRGGDDNVDSVEIAGTRNLIDAARQAGVEQFVFVSALGAAEDHPAPFLRGKAIAERDLRESGIPFTILSPNIFMEHWIPMLVGMPVQDGRPVTLVGEGRRRHTFVSMNDVAAFAVAVIDNPAAIGQQIPIGGPLAISWRDIIDATGRVLGREVPVVSVAPGEDIPGLPRVVAEIAADFEFFDSPLDMGEIARRFNVALTPMEEVVVRSFGGA